MPGEVISINGFLQPGDPQIAVMSIRHGATTLHTHDCYELVMVREGSCLHETNGRTVLLMPGDLFIIRPGEQHRYISNHGIALINCMFSLPEIAGVAEKLKDLPGAARLFTAHTDYLDRVHLDLPSQATLNRAFLGMMDTLGQRAPGWQVQLHAELTLLIIHCMRLFSELTLFEGDRRQYLGYVSKALQFIDDRYDSLLSVREIARHSGISVDYFSRQFHQITGVTPVEYLTRYRLARSMELLRNGHLVQEAASASGFQSLSHFSREFKRRIGITPSRYRNEHLPIRTAY